MLRLKLQLYKETAQDEGAGGSRRGLRPCSAVVLSALRGARSRSVIQAKVCFVAGRICCVRVLVLLFSQRINWISSNLSLALPALAWS